MDIASDFSVASKPSADVLIVGAGIVGLATALTLQSEGRDVVVLDPNSPASGCSAGNAGHIALNRYGSVAPPDVLWRLPKMLMDPHGPLSIKPGYLLRMMPWAIRLLVSLTKTGRARTAAGLTALNGIAIESYRPLLKASRSESLIETQGSIFAYLSWEALARGVTEISAFRAHGIAVEALDEAQLHNLEPALGPAVIGGLFFPECGRCVDPKGLGQHFAEAIVRNGGSFIHATAERLIQSEAGWTVATDQGAISATQVIVAAGRRSDALLEPLGYRVPLEGERGYHLMLPEPQVSLTRPVAMTEQAFIATPMSSGLRLAGTVEFAPPETPMIPRRADMLYDLALPYLPGLNAFAATRWMGLRPTLPDSLPAIGAASRHRGLFYNFGHHHLGLTHAAASARILAAIIARRPAAIETNQFSINRFNFEHQGVADC